MTTAELITDVYYAYRGKGASRVPAFASEKSNTALAIANRKKNEWARDSTQTWASNFKATAPNETGLVATTATTALTGTGTFFTDYMVGDKITVSGETVRTIATIPSDTSLTVTVAFSNTASSKTFTRQTIIATAVQEYSIHRSFMVPSDKVIVTTTIDQDVGFVTGTVQNRDTADVYFYDRAPKKLAFYQDILSSAQIVGGTLKVAGYYIPADLVLSTDLVPVDDPTWLVYATAAELARNDPAREDQYSSLNGMANDLYLKMINANRDLGFLQGKTIISNMPSIGSNLGSDWADGGLG
jgi:hypothetical protein